MSFSSDFVFTDLITYGDVTPPVGTAPEGAQYFVTSDGLPSPTPSEAWTYDAQTEAWVRDPAGDDPCQLNEYHHNMGPYFLNFAHENFAYNITVNVNGTPATLANIVGNVTDNGGGAFNFGAGTNGSFSKRANTAESVIAVGEYFEFSVGAVAQFSTLIIEITDDVAQLANVVNGNYRFSIASGGVTIFDPDNNNVYSQGQEAGTWRMTRTLVGWEFTYNGNVVYSTPVPDCFDYEGEQNDRIAANEAAIAAIPPLAPTATGVYNFGRYDTQFVVDGTNVVTGLDLTQAPQLTLRVMSVDANTPRSWQIAEIDVEQMLVAFNAGDIVDARVLVFDNDFLTLNIIDPATGEFNITDNGRQMEIVWMELQGPAVLPLIATDIKVGSLWEGHHVSAKPDGVVLNGETFTNADFPELVALALPFITDNGDGTSTNNWGDAFARPGVDGATLGVLQDDTTAVNGLAGTVIDANPTTISVATTGSGGARRNFGETNTTRTIALTGDAETAPVHRDVLVGVWGRVGVAIVDAENTTITNPNSPGLLTNNGDGTSTASRTVFQMESADGSLFNVTISNTGSLTTDPA